MSYTKEHNPLNIDSIDYEDIFLLSLKQEVNKKKIPKANESDSKKTNLITKKFQYLKNGIKNKINVTIQNCIEYTLQAKNPSLLNSNFILFATEPTETKQLKILYNTIYKKGKTAVFLTDRVSICKELRKSGFDIYFLRKSQSDFREKANNVLKQISANSIDPITLYYYYEHLPSFISLAKLMRKQLEYLKPEHVFVGYDLTQEGRLLATITKQLNIPSYTIQHGLLYKDNIHSKHIIDRYFVYGQYSVDILSASGFPKNKIKISGAPYFELHFDDIESNNKTSSKNILICLSGVGHSTSLQHHYEIIKTLKACANELHYIQFTIKLHRKDNIKYYSELAKMKNVNIIDSNEQHTDNIFHFLNNAIALITGSSSTATEAMIKKIPVVTVDLLNEYQEIDFIKAGVTYHSENKETLIKNLYKITENQTEVTQKVKSAEMFAHQYFSTGFKKPTEAILNNLINA